MARTTAERIAEADPIAPIVYAAEGRAAAAACVRRYTTFAEVQAHVDAIVCSEWWDETFPDAPVDVEVVRRSRNATFSAACRLDADAAVVAIIDGRHWSADVVLHELAHLAAGLGADHGHRFRAALAELWRREAGIVAQTCLLAEFDAAGLSH